MLGAENQQSGVIWVALAQEDGEARGVLGPYGEELELHEAALPARAGRPDGCPRGGVEA